MFAISPILANLAACAAAPVGQSPVPAEQVELPTVAPVSGLPFADGRSFSSLDEYLAFRHERGAYDVPWYRRVREGVYELVTRRTPGKPIETFTRQQLMEKFGFSR